jgi:hypothetical protein
MDIVPAAVMGESGSCECARSPQKVSLLCWPLLLGATPHSAFCRADCAHVALSVACDAANRIKEVYSGESVAAPHAQHATYARTHNTYLCTDARTKRTHTHTTQTSTHAHDDTLLSITVRQYPCRRTLHARTHARTSDRQFTWSS